MHSREYSFPTQERKPVEPMTGGRKPNTGPSQTQTFTYFSSVQRTKKQLCVSNQIEVHASRKLDSGAEPGRRPRYPEMWCGNLKLHQELRVSFSYDTVESISSQEEQDFLVSHPAPPSSQHLCLGWLSGKGPLLPFNPSLVCGSTTYSLKPTGKAMVALAPVHRLVFPCQQRLQLYWLLCEGLPQG